jgi:DNA-binding LacI/PurR family transcriptional regulator
MAKENKVKTIAVIAGNIANEFCRDLMESIRSAIPQGKDIHVIILPGEVLVNEESNVGVWQYDAMFNGVYSLAKQCEPDGIIFVLGSMGWKVSADEIHEFVEKYKDIPKVLISSQDKDYVTVNYDNETGIREAIDYLVNVNGFTSICMLGGEDFNHDAMDRKEIFIKCLEENGLPYNENFYETTDMSSHTEAAARRLLENNPNVEAIFCVNDTSARGLYNVMEDKGLVPGKDIMVFGFDNTRLSSEMNPSLTSIGPDDTTLGHRAVELLLDMMNGKEVSSEKVKTRLYGRQSFPYEMYHYTNKELLDIDEEFIYRMFDDCFYRYRSSAIRKSAVDLRRLYFEFVFRILNAYRNRFMPVEEYDEIGNMIDVFFANGAMEYTDATKLLECIQRLQYAINVIQKSLAVNAVINRLFLRMRDDCIKEICKTNINQRNITSGNVKKHRSHLVIGMDYIGDKDKSLAEYIKNMSLICADSGSLYMFDEPVERSENEEVTYPDDINMKCFIKDGEMHVTPKDRQKRKTKNLFSAVAETSHLDCMTVYPIVYQNKTYGLYFCELTDRIYTVGGFISTTIGMVMHQLMN